MKRLAKILLVVLAAVVFFAATSWAERKTRKERLQEQQGGSSYLPGTPPTVTGGGKKKEPETPSTPGTPAVPSGPIAIKVIRPQPGEALTIPEGYTYVIGTIPSDQFTLRCNDKLVDVYSDGAFVGFVPIKRIQPPKIINGTNMDASFVFVAMGQKDRTTNIVYGFTPLSPSAKKGGVEKYAEPKIVESLEDTMVGLENGVAASGKPLLNLGKAVYFPKGARIKVKEKRGDQYLAAQPIEDGELWLNEAQFKLTTEELPNVDVTNQFTSQKGARWTAYSFATAAPLPMVLEETNDRATVKLRFLCNPPRAFVFPQPNLVWGLQAVYQPGETTVTVKFAPNINKDKPLEGVKIMLDPGHHPQAGALGPRGTEERALTLLICKQLSELFKAKGAIPTLSRDLQPLDLNARQTAFRAANPDIVLSIHFNAVIDGEDPRHTWGSQAIFLYPHSLPLAKTIQRYLVPTVRGKDLGFVQRNLVVTRFPDCPTVLIEPTHIILPDEEKKLLTPEYRQEIAKAIAEATSNFLLGESGLKR